MWTSGRAQGSGGSLSQAGQALAKLAQLKQPDVQQLCSPAHLGPCPFPLSPCLLQAALRCPQLVLQLCVAGLQVLQKDSRQVWWPPQMSRVISPAWGIQYLSAIPPDPTLGQTPSVSVASSLPPLPRSPWSPINLETTELITSLF